MINKISPSQTPFNEKETGKLVSGISNNKETAIFAEIKPGVFLTYEGEVKEETLEKCTWVSGDKPVTIIGLSKGKYFIKEIIAPEGYVLNETLVGFEVKANGKVTKAVMKNDLEVKVLKAEKKLI